MKHQIMLVFAMLALGHVSQVVAQPHEITLDRAQARITTVPAMRTRREPRISGEEILRLKLGTVVNTIARSINQDTHGGKTDYWYRVNLPNGKTGWLIGGFAA